MEEEHILNIEVSPYQQREHSRQLSSDQEILQDEAASVTSLESEEEEKPETAKKEPILEEVFSPSPMRKDLTTVAERLAQKKLQNAQNPNQSLFQSKVESIQKSISKQIQEQKGNQFSMSKFYGIYDEDKGTEVSLTRKETIMRAEQVLNDLMGESAVFLKEEEAGESLRAPPVDDELNETPEPMQMTERVRENPHMLEDVYSGSKCFTPNRENQL
jgi:hypothetical protein